MLIDEVGYMPGKDLLFGSDGMPHGVQYALESALFPPFPGQVLELSEFVAGYCMADLENGFIEVAIDHENRKIITEVTLKLDSASSASKLRQSSLGYVGRKAALAAAAGRGVAESAEKA
jgi:hypothetical protein